MRRMIICAAALLLGIAGCGEKAPPQSGLPAEASAQADKQTVSKTQPAAPAEEDKSRQDPWQEFARRRAKLKGPEGLTLTLATDKQEYYAGEPILVTTTYKMKGPGTVQIWAGPHNRWGGIGYPEWTVVAPDGQPAPDPLAGSRMGIGGVYNGPGRYATVSEGEPFSQGYYVNEWARFDRAGEYEIAGVNTWLSGAGSVASDRVKIKVRKPTEIEINAAIARYTQAMDEKKPDRDREGGFDYYKAALFLTFLHDERALPHYINFLKVNELSFQAACGIYGLPDHKNAFAALSAKIAEEDYPISSTVASLYEELYLSLNPLPEGVSAWGRVGPAKERRDKITARLRFFAATMSPRARAISVFALTPQNSLEPEHAIELAKSLKDMPQRSLASAVRRVGLKKMPEVVPYLESFLNHKIKAVRSAALGSLIKQGRDEYLEEYLDDYVSERPRYEVHGIPKELSEARQLKLASLLDHDDRKVAERAANILARFGTTKKIVPSIRKGLEKCRYRYGPRRQLFEAWVKVDPEGAKRPFLNYMRSGTKSNRRHSVVRSLKHYIDDPQVVQLVLEIALGERAQWHAQRVLIGAKRPEVVPVLLEKARAMSNLHSSNNWKEGLEVVTGHIVPLTIDHNSPAKQAAMLDEWERWWHEYENKSLTERMRSNIGHALGLLNNGDLSGRAHRLLTKITGKKFDKELYEDRGENLTKEWEIRTVDHKKLNALWAKWWAANRDTFRPVERE